ncbi:MAG: prohibitin family protein [Oscillospiraceae bacterium]|jgi:regulator of protease activity HflC (stomatin/prohibitin superfamily)|nr:prohibitin family protein [Oscillospiraceae bacterium]
MKLVKNKDGDISAAKAIAAATATLVLIILLAFSCLGQVAAGHTGLLVTFGSVNDSATLSPGIHVKAPWQNIVSVDNRVQKYDVASVAASKDLQTVSSTTSVNYRLLASSSAAIYKEVGLDIAEKILYPAVQDCVKQTTAKFRAEELITNRQLVAEDMKQALSAKVSEYGIVIDVFNITNFDFSSEFNAAIERKSTAEQEVLAEKQELEKAKVIAERNVEIAKGEALQQEEQARGEAAAIVAKAEAEATAVRLIQEQLAKDPTYIEYLKVLQWDGKNVSTVLGDTVGIFVTNGAAANNEATG